MHDQATPDRRPNDIGDDIPMMIVERCAHACACAYDDSWNEGAHYDSWNEGTEASKRCSHWTYLKIGHLEE
jgi:hypothetical protein